MPKDGSPYSHDRRNRNRNRFGLAKESLGFSAAEGASMAASLGVIAVADNIAPKAIDKATKIVAKKLIEPHLEGIERTIKKVCRVNGCQVDETRPRQQRAENIARALVLFTPAWAIGMAAKVWTRNKMNKHFKIEDGYKNPNKTFLDKTAYKIMSPYGWKIFIADEGVHYGSLIYLSTAGSEYTNDLINSTSKMLQKQGVSERKAHELSSMAMIWELPNLLGLGAGIGMIAGKHHFGWGDRRRPQPPHGR